MNRFFKWISKVRYWREMLTDIKLYRSGHRRVAEYGTRGRTHKKIAGKDEGTTPRMVIRREPIGVITPSRVYCESEEKWYTVDEWQARNKGY